MEKIGTVEILRMRIYPLDAEMAMEPRATTVVVQPGVFDVYSDGLSYLWVMEGRINTGRMHRLGDGLFTLSPNDDPGDTKVRFPSRTYGADEWAEFLASPTCSEGPDQRLRFTLNTVSR